jgi:hypothetical protein
MKVGVLLWVFILTAPGFAFAQTFADSSFSLLFNSGISFTHANDPHINRWLEKYGYPTEPHVPSSLNLEVAAVPAYSRLLYTLRLSTINSGKNLTSFNILGGLYMAMVKKQSFQVYLGLGAGYHDDIVTLNGNMPPDYKLLATQYHTPLALRRTGLFLEPALRAFWFPVRYHNTQLGLYAGLGYDLDFNSRWGLGYYDNNHGKYDHFRKLKKPDDQQRVSEYGLAYNAGLSLKVNLH